MPQLSFNTFAIGDRQLVVQEAFETIFKNSWRVALGSFIGYIIGQSHDVWAYHFWKNITNGKLLWLRNCVSTITSQIIGTTIFIVISFLDGLDSVVFNHDSCFRQCCLQP